MKLKWQMFQGQDLHLTNQMYKNRGLSVFYNWSNLALKLSFLQTAEINALSNSLFQGETKEGGLSFLISMLKFPIRANSLPLGISPPPFFPRWGLANGEVYGSSWSRRRDVQFTDCLSLQAPAVLQLRYDSSQSLGTRLCAPYMCYVSVCSWSTLSAWAIYDDSSQGARPSLPGKILTRVPVP